MNLRAISDSPLIFFVHISSAFSYKISVSSFLCFQQYLSQVIALHFHNNNGCLPFSSSHLQPALNTPPLQRLPFLPGPCHPRVPSVSQTSGGQPGWTPTALHSLVSPWLSPLTPAHVSARAHTTIQLPYLCSHTHLSRNHKNAYYVQGGVPHRLL